MYNFDEIIDRQDTNALNTDGFRGYMFPDDPNIEFPTPDEELIRMWVADMEFAVPEVVINAVKERLDRQILGYTRVFSEDYYKAFVGWCERRYGWTFSSEELVTSNGVIPALYELVAHLCAPDERVFFLTPSYSYFMTAAIFNDREYVCSDLIRQDDQFVVDFDDLDKKAADSKNQLFILCHPHNPTGRVWTEEELQRIGDIMVKHNTWVISDEIHCDLTRQGKKHIPLAKLFPTYDRIITCMAPSKTFNLAGMMISNVIISNTELREKWLARHYNFDNPLSIAASQAAYEKGADWLAELQKYLDENFDFAKRYIETRLPRATMDISEATYLAWVDVNAYFDDSVHLPKFFATQAGVLLEGGNMFVQNSNGFIRLNLACPRSTLTKGLERICDAVIRHNTN